LAAYPSIRCRSDAAPRRAPRRRPVARRTRCVACARPYADPAYARLRGALALDPSGELAARKLDGQWALHPALAHASDLYAAGQWLPIVAVAPPYQGRSHFDAQDCVENGTDRPHGAQDGWINRCVGALGGARAVAAAAVMPLAARGAAHVETWSPPLPTQVDPVLLQRLSVLYARDARLDAAFRAGLAGADDERAASADARKQPRLVQALDAVGGFLARDDGPRIAFVEDDGWDTHANQAAILARKLAELDAGLAAAQVALGAAWKHTALIVVSEFGRTAAINGTGGTDHGTGNAMFLAGGAIRGGRIAGDWPGLSPSALNEGRDLRATTDLRAVFKGVLAGHLGVGEGALETRVFPGSAKIRASDGLLAARAA
jgi:uncharacterized protein (DUF1501 family)